MANKLTSGSQVRRGEFRSFLVHLAPGEGCVRDICFLERTPVPRSHSPDAEKRSSFSYTVSRPLCNTDPLAMASYQACLSTFPLHFSSYDLARARAQSVSTAIIFHFPSSVPIRLALLPPRHRTPILSPDRFCQQRFYVIRENRFLILILDFLIPRNRKLSKEKIPKRIIKDCSKIVRQQVFLFSK